MRPRHARSDVTGQVHRLQVKRRNRPKFGAMKVWNLSLFSCGLLCFTLGSVAGQSHRALDLPWIVRADAAEVHLFERTRPVQRVVLGNEQLKTLVPLLGRGGVAVVANATSVLQADVRPAPTHLVDTLLALGVHVKRVFAPEHGFRGDAENGAHIEDGLDPKTGLQIISLHGDRRKPRPEDLEGVRAIVFDIQDVGARFYTYLSTLALVMEAAAESDVAVVILDRPNPHGYHVAGPLLQPEFTSFVGQIPVPMVHGMTLGEAGQMINGEYWLADSLQCNLTVIKCRGWVHSDRWDPPVAPSPNLPHASSIALYPSLCLFEPTHMSIGRGTEFPFEVFGAPDYPSNDFQFTPMPIPGASPHPKHEGVLCHGVDLRAEGQAWLNTPSGFDLRRVIEVQSAMPREDWITSPSFFDKLAGTNELRSLFGADSEAIDTVFERWTTDLVQFVERREAYLAYPLTR